MTEILFLAHRIPYPPDKGDKIRSWHFLAGLARRHTVHLGAFVDDDADWRHERTLSERCGGEICLRALPSRLATARSAIGLLNGEPLTLPYYRDRALSQWVGNLASRRPLEAVFVFSSSMAQYAAPTLLAPGTRRVLDLCDVDSDKWRQYAGTHKWPMSRVYAREARLLEQHEREYVEGFDATLVIAETEAASVRQFAPRGAARVHVIGNGVDASYFDPATLRDDPYPDGVRRIVFTGAMDYRANIDGVTWFANEILPRILGRLDRVQFVIVGARPAEEVLALASQHVRVTGRVDDVRPYLQHADVVVAPLRIARGVQNKVLEALAMAKHVIATPVAMQGLGRAAKGLAATASSESLFADLVVEALAKPRIVAAAARDCVAEHFSWDASVAKLHDVIAARQASLDIARAS
jgi:sugar transferase (PEP-CTERM/EpsH1 system associated)